MYYYTFYFFTLPWWITVFICIFSAFRWAELPWQAHSLFWYGSTELLWGGGGSEWAVPHSPCLLHGWRMDLCSFMWHYGGPLLQEDLGEASQLWHRPMVPCELLLVHFFIPFMLYYFYYSLLFVVLFTREMHVHGFIYIILVSPHTRGDYSWKHLAVVKVIFR